MFIKAHGVSTVEGVTFAGGGKIVRSGETDFHRALGTASQQGSDTQPLVSVGFFTPKGTSHTAHVDSDAPHGNIKHFGNQLLSLGRMLGRCVD